MAALAAWGALAIAAGLCAGCAGLLRSHTTTSAARSADAVAGSPFTWANEVVETDGRGIAPATIREEPQRSLAAKQAAKAAAIAGLKHRIARLTVTGSQTVGTAMNINLSVKRAIEKWLQQNAEVVYEKEIEPGVWEVRLRAPLAPISQILQQHRITPQGIPVLTTPEGQVPRET